MRFIVEFEKATPNGGMRVLVDGEAVAESPIPAEAATQAAVEMHRRYVAELLAAKEHAISEPCDICGGTGTDYIGRTCHRVVDKIASR